MTPITTTPTAVAIVPKQQTTAVMLTSSTGGPVPNPLVVGAMTTAPTAADSSTARRTPVAGETTMTSTTNSNASLQPALMTSVNPNPAAPPVAPPASIHVPGGVDNAGNGNGNGTTTDSASPGALGNSFQNLPNCFERY